MKNLTVVKVSGAAAAASLFALAGLAWACTGALQIATVTPQAGPGGSDVIVTGYAASVSPVEVHWNDITGPVLAVGTPARAQNSKSPYFSIPFTIPAGTAPDVYYLVVAQKDAAGILGPRVTATVSVAPAAGSSSNPHQSPATSADLWSGLNQAHGGAIASPVNSTGSADSSAMGPGIAMVAVGLPVLMGGLASMALKRRRAGAARKSG